MPGFASARLLPRLFQRRKCLGCPASSQEAAADLGGHIWHAPLLAGHQRDVGIDIRLTIRDALQGTARGGCARPPSARRTGSGLALSAIAPRSSHAEDIPDRAITVIHAVDDRLGEVHERIRSSAKSARVWATRSTIIDRCSSRSFTNSRRFCQSTDDRADLRAVMRLLISAAMVSPPTWAAGTSRH